MDRLLDYYKDFSTPVIIADSSIVKYRFNNRSVHYQHLYTPDKTFTQKIEIVLSKIKTPYVVMCADDDFIIPSSILACVDFLQKNKSYAIVQGACISYEKRSIHKETIEFRLMYKIQSYDIEMDDPLERLETMFKEYRSVLYAVHRTDVLRLAFRNAGAIVKNLYLNEYLTAVVPVLYGKYKELPVLYQVREYSEDSDDKTTDNLDIIFSDEQYRNELNSFIDLLVQNASMVVPMDKSLIRKKIREVLEMFSRSPLIGNKNPKISFKKRIGFLIKNIPFLGTWLIAKNRKLERENDLKKVIKTETEHQHLITIASVLEKHASAVSR